ncbi:MAG: transketolase C-terminal domain-containing protein [Azospirillaceae bacterium]|nr:transketolase C-terminal domain-containing protein [Azospirillaceae bacterium]
MSRILTYAEAISEATVQAMERDPNIFITGIAVDYPSGIFGTTTAAYQRFGSARVFDAPAMENALTGIAIGAAASGKRPLIVHPRNDFMFLAFDNLINLAAKWSYMYGGQAGSVPIVVRAVIGKGWGQGATHSQSLQAPLAHFPGLTVAMPATPRDAKGLLLAALQADGPVVLLEHRALYNVSGPVPSEPEPTPLGRAAVLRPGRDITIVTTSLMTIEAEQACKDLARLGVEAELVDLRSIRPLDSETILASVRKTGRLLVADTSWELCGVTSEVAALAAEQAFGFLKAPVRRIALADCPAPVSQVLEASFYPRASTLVRAALSLLGKADQVETTDRPDDFKGPY